MKFRRSIWVLSFCLLLPVLIAGYLLLTADRGETLFHGKPEKRKRLINPIGQNAHDG